MNRTRQETTTRIPIRRKGTKYIAGASLNVNNAVPVVLAIRDMLHLAQTAREVREMIKQRLLKINGRTVYHLNESIQLFSILEADKPYVLTLLPTKRFSLQETKMAKGRMGKIIGKRLVKDGKLQYSLHDGTSIASKEKWSVGDTLYLDLKNKVKSHVALQKGSSVFVISGKYTGLQGTVTQKEGSALTITFKEGSAHITQDTVVAQ